MKDCLYCTKASLRVSLGCDDECDFEEASPIELKKQYLEMKKVSASLNATADEILRYIQEETEECLHPKKINATTFGDLKRGVEVYFCPECEKWWEEEVENEFDS